MELEQVAEQLARGPLLGRGVGEKRRLERGGLSLALPALLNLSWLFLGRLAEGSMYGEQASSR